MLTRPLLACVALIFAIGPGRQVFAQAPSSVPAPSPRLQGQIGSTASPDPSLDQIRPNYVLGASDQIVIQAFEVEEISNRPFRIDGDGFLTLPLVGRIRAAGVSVEQLEGELVKLLREFVKVPQVSISVVQFRSEPVFLVGAFRTPGVYPLTGRRTLFDLLASVGGLQSNAVRRIKLTRRLSSGAIPRPGAIVDDQRKVSTLDIAMGSLRENINPDDDIELKAFDMITADRSEMIYVSGEITRVGAIELADRESLSVSQLIAMSGGVTRDADVANVRVLRPVLDTSRRAEIRVNYKEILAGRQPDFPVMANDLLYIPKNGRRQNWTRVGVIGSAAMSPLLLLFVR